MFQRNIRKKKGISPVISTIILIVVALVIALLVGVFAFGLFTSQTKSVTLQSANLYAATGTLNYVLKDPGTAGTTVSSGMITGPGVTASTCAGAVATGVNPLTCTTTGAVTVGDTYDYVINLANGQSISGSVVGQ